VIKPKYFLFLFFIISTCFAFAQSDSTKNRGTVRIAKPKQDSVYIKAEMKFQQFQIGNKNNKQQPTIQSNNVIAPFPLISSYSTPFDYTLFFNKNSQIEPYELAEKITDTIRIQIKILDNGKAYYHDATPLMMLNGVPAYYNKQMNAYKLDAIHYRCMEVLKQITQWKPAYILITSQEKFKRQTVIKAKKKKLSATGVLTIIFSTVPFEE